MEEKHCRLMVDPSYFAADSAIFLLVQAGNQRNGRCSASYYIPQSGNLPTAIGCNSDIFMQHLLEFFQVSGLEDFQIPGNGFNLFFIRCDLQVDSKLRSRPAENFSGVFRRDPQYFSDLIMIVVKGLFQNEDSALLAVELLEQHQ